MYLVENKDVADFDVTKMRDGEDIAWCQDIFFANEGGNDILQRLRANELQGGSC